MLNDGDNMKTTDVYNNTQMCVSKGKVVHMTSNNTNKHKFSGWKVWSVETI